MRKKLFKAALILTLVGLAMGGSGTWLMFSANTPIFEGEHGVKIAPGSSFEAALDSLDAGGILASRQTFTWMAKLTGWGDQIKAGYYTFEGRQSNYDLLMTLRRGLQTPIRLTIPPGSRAEVAAKVAGRNMAFDADAFLAALRDPTLAEELGTDTLHLFSYMLPETYFFYWLTDAPTVVRRIKQETDKFFTDEMRQHARRRGLSVDAVLSLAAIVEWETSVEEEKARVAGVYINRLDQNWPLQADPTVQYAILALEGQKRRLFNRDYEINHPYNTYQFKGLPPGPVTNPSPSSIRAVVDAEEHNYMFFVAKPGGGHTFNATLSGHTRDAAIFHRYMREQRRRQQSGS